jgi:hypothetical protein
MNTSSLLICLTSLYLVGWKINTLKSMLVGMSCNLEGGQRGKLSVLLILQMQHCSFGWLIVHERDTMPCLSEQLNPSGLQRLMCAAVVGMLERKKGKELFHCRVLVLLAKSISSSSIEGGDQQQHDSPSQTIKSMLSSHFAPCLLVFRFQN